MATTICSKTILHSFSVTPHLSLQRKPWAQSTHRAVDWCQGGPISANHTLHSAYYPFGFATTRFHGSSIQQGRSNVSSRAKMADYFHHLASHAAANRLAIVDPPHSASCHPKQYTYAELLSRVTVFREHLVRLASEAGKELAGARIGLLVPPGVEFVAALLSIWTVQAIVGRRYCMTGTLKASRMTSPSPDMSYTSIAGDVVHRERLRPGFHHLPFNVSVKS